MLKVFARIFFCCISVVNTHVFRCFFYLSFGIIGMNGWVYNIFFDAIRLSDTILIRSIVAVDRWSNLFCEMDLRERGL